MIRAVVFNNNLLKHVYWLDIYGLEPARGLDVAPGGGQGGLEAGHLHQGALLTCLLVLHSCRIFYWPTCILQIPHKNTKISMLSPHLGPPRPPRWAWTPEAAGGQPPPPPWATSAAARYTWAAPHPRPRSWRTSRGWGPLSRRCPSPGRGRCWGCRCPGAGARPPGAEADCTSPYWRPICPDSGRWQPRARLGAEFGVVPQIS